MIKFIGAAVWICIATLGAVYFSFQMSAKPAGAEPAEKTVMGGLDYVKTEVISVPLIRNATIDGYFLARLVYTVDPAEMKKLTVPAESIITDVVYSTVYSDPKLDFSKHASLDLDLFRAGIRDSINKAVKHDLVKEVLIEQLDYLSKDEIRDNALRRRASGTNTRVPTFTGEAEPAPAAH